jgi:two-component system, NarL family, response regulator NreC
LSIRILLADDHQIVRDGLRALLEKEQDVEVVAEAANGRDAVRLALSLKPTVVLIDVSMPDLNGVEATRQIVESLPTVKVIALSMHSDKRYVGAMLKAGASGYLLKDLAFDEVIRAIAAVTQNQVYLSRGVVGLVVEDYVQHLSSEEVEAGTPSLTPREREILQLIAEGRSTKEIALTLHISIKTVETHRRQLMDRLDIHSVAELTKYAVRHGLTSLE